ncbi:ferrochelatase [Marinibactrum halimedae]|nr:ferrochelatase [Marinibactrum halimedae]MCD9459856.1 ferrochelatase [Marinibactrum halimedae]
MKYINTPHYDHSSQAKVGVLITNLGTPDEATKPALRRYLKEFLADPRVVEVPRLIWWMVLNLVILNIRPARSAKAYQTVWTDEGSPLMIHTQHQAQALSDHLKELGHNVIVKYAMRYGNPSITNTLDEMAAEGVQRLLVLPLYPQYCGATSASTFDAIASDFTQRRWIPELRFVTHYHDDAAYIDACAEKIKAHWEDHGKANKLLFSYHGIPKRYLTNGDPYHCECYKTSRLIAEQLNLDEDEYMTTFQSRFGREEWLKPYTDETLKSFPSAGVHSVQVFCPGFSADCLETIEEIGEENREYFMEAGGKRYEYITALNAEVGHIHALSQLIERNLSGWNTKTTATENAQQLTQQRAKAMGAAQ